MSLEKQPQFRHNPPPAREARECRQNPAPEVAGAGTAECVIDLNRINKSHAVEACSRIGSMVSNLGLTGLDALETEAEFYELLSNRFLKLRAAGSAIEYVQVRKQAVTFHIEQIKCGSPDMFDPEHEIDKACMAETIAEAVDSGVIDPEEYPDISDDFMRSRFMGYGGA